MADDLTIVALRRRSAAPRPGSASVAEGDQSPTTLAGGGIAAISCRMAVARSANRSSSDQATDPSSWLGRGVVGPQLVAEPGVGDPGGVQELVRALR
jgi:hypothetical protein